ncbi:shufflon system plasmid conjugative transfer pilus tip adhesin PilV [Mesorhizobium sp. SP-1A]|uniref:shufflon system plasmid conjugative transfer pilus tip adhesin PilV n=1 Tax=Mesorhizobium sp. SP-1A TaxID=3077840 RepID=UPI0028F6F452|nr:shufflon system plasmid conjugative transfer pilus tip adhesin PilV [Mesorhizobium sp. SP-1A]
MKRRLVDVIRSRRNKGFSLIEIGAALVVVGLMSAAISVMIAEYTEQRKAKTAAEKLAEVHEAASGYIKANYSALMTNTTGGKKVVVASGRKSITDQPPVGSLQRDGFLPAGFIDNNAYGQQHSVIIRQVTPPSGGTPYLEAIVTTHGGRAIPDDQLARVAGFVGVSGGYFGGYDINATDNGMIVGNFGGWRTQKSAWDAGGITIQPGHVQSTLAFENGNLLTDYLYRNDVPGVPEANTMNTSINMGGNNINNVNTLKGVAKSDAKYGGNNVVTIDGHVEAIDVWARNATLSNNLTVNGTSTVSGNATFGKDVTVAGSVTADTVNTKNATVSEKLKTKDLEVTAKADIQEIDLSKAYLVMSNNGGRPDGRFPQTGGKIQLRDLLPRTVAHYSYQVTESKPKVYKPVCGSGGTQKIMVYRQVESYTGDIENAKPVISNGVFATSLDANFWEVKWEGTPRHGTVERAAIAQTFCSYQ